MKETCIAIGQGRPEIHRFEVRCFEQKRDKLSRYLEVRCLKNPVRRLHLIAALLNFFTFKNVVLTLVRK